MARLTPSPKGATPAAELSMPDVPAVPRGPAPSRYVSWRSTSLFNASRPAKRNDLLAGLPALPALVICLALLLAASAFSGMLDAGGA